MPAPESIRTARLFLRKPVREDAPLLFASYAQDSEVTRFLMWRPHSTVADSQDFIEHALQGWAKGSEFCWFLFTHSDGKLVGSIGARIKPGEIELGYALARPCWGQGLMLEAIAAVVEWAFTNQSVSRVCAVCDTENHASARLLEKAGFKREAVLPGWSAFPNLSEFPRDCYSYAKARHSEGVE